jgi:NADPH2 dehydrogenase
MSGKSKPLYPRVAQLKTSGQFLEHLHAQNIDLPFAQDPRPLEQSPFATKHLLRSGSSIGNAFCILPMEGWDGTEDGRPTEFTKRRWRNFARSGAKLLWGCEAVAVRHEGRANPNQLLINEANLPYFVALFQLVQDEHQAVFGRTDDLLTGLQLTHSGRFCKPNSKTKMEPRILYHHPVLDKKFGLPEDYPLMDDSDLDALVEDYIKAAVLAQQAGFQFVDIKHCHGYLGHELLGAVAREGKYGGSLDNRFRFLRDVVAGIRSRAPGLQIGVRLSLFDWMPFKPGEDQKGVPAWEGKYPYAFGGDETGLKEDLSAPFAFVEELRKLDIELLCTTAGSPYYNPHIQRPALFPPSDGYLPPEDPLQGVARQIRITGELKKAFPDMYVVGSAYSYLQEWLPQVAEQVLLNGMADSIGLGRMVLSYPELPADVLTGKFPQRGKICRTFSDCTTAPRNGMISGCFPLDPFYKQMEIYGQLKAIKEQ